MGRSKHEGRARIVRFMPSPRETTNEARSAAEAGVGIDVADPRTGGRHAGAVAVLEGAVEPIVEDMGFELLLLEWAGGGKRRVMRVFLDHANGVSIDDCSRMSRIIGNTLDAHEAAAAEGEALPDNVDPALLGLLRQPYVLEVSSPGIDRPLTKRRHFEAQVGGKVKLETYAPLEPEWLTPSPDEHRNERKFHGRLAAVEADPDAPDDPRRGFVLVDDVEGARTIRIPLPRLRRANLVWEG